MSLASGDNPKALTGTASTTPASLGNNSCSSVVVQCDPGASVNLLVGDAGSQPFGLKPGQALTIPCSNTNQVYVATASGTATWNAIKVN